MAFISILYHIIQNMQYMESARIRSYFQCKCLNPYLERRSIPYVLLCFSALSIAIKAQALVFSYQKLCADNLNIRSSAHKSCHVLYSVNIIQHGFSIMEDQPTFSELLQRHLHLYCRHCLYLQACSRIR